MKSAHVVLAVTALLLIALPAWAQSVDDELAPAAPDQIVAQSDSFVRPSTATSRTRTTADDLADQLWRDAASALAAGDAAEARELWREFIVRYPDDRRTQTAARLAQAITLAESAPYRRNSITSQLGRAQLAIFGALYGGSVGLLAGLEATDGDGSAELPVWLSIAGAGAGLGLSLGLSRGSDVRPAQPALVAAGAFWSYGIGFAMVGSGPRFQECTKYGSYYSQPYDKYCNVSPTAFRMLPLAFSIVGVGATSYIAHRHPDLPAGDVALANAGGLWGTMTGLFAAMALDLESDYAPVNVLLPGTLLGLTAGITLATQLEISRPRMQFINLSGVLGIGLAGAVGVSTEVDEPTGWGLLLLGGQTVGLVTGALVTRRRERSTRLARSLSSLQFAPTLLGDAHGRQHRGLVLSGRW